MTLSERLSVLERLGQILSQKDEYRDAVIHRSSFHNGWFTKENQELAIKAIADKMLAAGKLTEWLGAYQLPEWTEPQKIGLVLAGNIPLVGFHDILCVFVAGHYAKIKLSDKDPFLLPYLFKSLQEIDERTGAYFEVADQLKGFDAVIATGSNNSARYFEAYFGKHPNIIRRNRNAVALLDGKESEEELLNLGKDVFRYFGLGCRNVAKIYVPMGYDFTPLLEAFHHYREIANHSKYKNNFDYNYALFMLNKVSYKANGCIILTENRSVQSHIAGLHYEYYDDQIQLIAEIKGRQPEIQCILSRKEMDGIDSFPFGKAQEPELWHYADGVDTMQFLIDL